MPWVETLLPPSPGTVRAVDPDHLVVWTEHGLFRYERGLNPCVRLLHPPEDAAAHFDATTGAMRWNEQVYQLVGDPAVVPHTSVAAEVTATPQADGKTCSVRFDRRRRRVELLDEVGTVALTIPDFPRTGDDWHFAGFSNGLVLAGPGGLRRFEFADPPAGPSRRWAAAGTEYAALLAGVLAAPDDDLPRLVLADWLEENGDAARAEFIRIQCRLAERERTAPIPDGDPDTCRAIHLAQEHGEGWWRDMPAVRGVMIQHWSDDGWWRGFPAVSVSLTKPLARTVGPLLAAAPLEKVTIPAPSSAQAAALLKSPLAERLRVLELSQVGGGRRAGMTALLAAPQLAGLRGLEVSGYDDCGEVTALVAESAPLASLEWVCIREASDAGAAALAAAAGLPAVRWVWVGKKDWYTPATRRALRKRFAQCVFRG